MLPFSMGSARGTLGLGKRYWRLPIHHPVYRRLPLKTISKIKEFTTVLQFSSVFFSSHFVFLPFPVFLACTLYPGPKKMVWAKYTLFARLAHPLTQATPMQLSVHPINLSMHSIYQCSFLTWLIYFWWKRLEILFYLILHEECAFSHVRLSDNLKKIP